MLGYGLLAEPETVARHIRTLSENLPAAAAGLIGDQLQSVSEGAAGAKGLGLLASLGIALFGARSGARALMDGLNVAFHAGEGRDFLRANLVALAITLAGIIGLALVGSASAALAALSGPAGKIASFAFLVVSAAGGAGLMYRHAPNKPAPAWSAIWPGALTFALAWLGATAGFAWYAANFGNYNATYGSLGAVIVLITWFYASGFFLLFGAEVAALRDRRIRSQDA